MVPSLIPPQHRKSLSAAIASGATQEAKRLISTLDLDVNAFLDDECQRPLLMEALCAYSFHPEAPRLSLLSWLLEKGADPGIYCNNGYSCLHVAVQQPQLIKALDVLLDFRPDVNTVDSGGANIVYWAIQAFPWRTQGKERNDFLKVIEKLLMLGADLDMANHHGVTPRKWLDRAPEDVRALAARCEAISTQPS